MRRGLWDDHFIEKLGEAGLRDRLWHYFSDDPTLDQDLRKLFGQTKGRHGHFRPKLETDSWAAVDKATPMLDTRFATWVKAKKK